LVVRAKFNQAGRSHLSALIALTIQERASAIVLISLVQKKNRRNSCLKTPGDYWPSGFADQELQRS
jgi:hypothetical protein